MTKNFGKLLKRAFACFLVVVMTLSAVPMSGFVGLEMPKWSQLFATKASAEDELTPEDCVDIYMDNSYVWLKRDTDKYDFCNDAGGQQLFGQACRNGRRNDGLFGL